MRLQIWLILLFVISASSARAQFFSGPSSAGTGNAGRAAVDPGEVMFMNPAALAFLQKYVVSGYYDVGQGSGLGDQSSWGFSLADGTPDTYMPGALSYIRKRTDATGGVSDTQQDIQLNLAGQPLKYMALGLAVHRFSDQILSAVRGQEYVQFNGHLGVILIPTPQIGIGLVGYDLVPKMSESTPSSLRVVPTYAVGANYLYEKIFRARLDLIRPDMNNKGGRNDLAFGVESIFQESLIVRLGGYCRETADQTFWTAGLGYHGPRLSIDYGFQKDIRTGDNLRHVVDLWFPL